MNYIKYILLLFFLAQTSFGQTFHYPELPAIGHTLADYIPKGWYIRDSTSGDLNNDKLADIALIIEYEDTISELRQGNILASSNPRIIFVLFKTISGYKKNIQNNTFILRKGEGGMAPDPESTLTIAKGVLILNFQFTRDNTEYKFRYQNNALTLIGAKTGGSDGNDKVEFWDFNFLTKKAKHTIEPIGEGKSTTEWKSITIEKLKKFSELIFPFEWEVFPDTFI